MVTQPLFGGVFSVAAIPPPVTTPGTTAAPCVDDPSRPCIPSLLPTICADSVFRNYCKKSCGLCVAATPPSVTTPGTTAAPCVDDPSRPCIPSLLPTICADSVFRTYCKKSCGLCVATAMPAAMTTTTATTGCQDSNQQSCASEILHIVCFDDVMKFSCRKSCKICDLTAPPTAACVDTHPMQCSNQTMLAGICADRELAELFCQKSCGLCHGTTPPPPSTSICQDDDVRCYNIQFLATACPDPVLRNVCRQSCSVCTK